MFCFNCAMCHTIKHNLTNIFCHIFQTISHVHYHFSYVMYDKFLPSFDQLFITNISFSFFLVLVSFFNFIVSKKCVFMFLLLLLNAMTYCFVYDIWFNVYFIRFLAFFVWLLWSWCLLFHSFQPSNELYVIS